MTSPLLRAVVGRGKDRQTIRRVLRMEALSLAATPLAEEPDVSDLPTFAPGRTLADAEVRALAERALAAIAAGNPHHVFASRRGVCAGLAEFGRPVVLFRREGVRVRLEVYPARGDSGWGAPRLYALPYDLERRASALLSGLP